MKIIILQGPFLPVPAVMGGAVEKIWDKLGQEFSRLGHEVVHISRKIKELPAEEYLNGVTHIRIKGYDTPLSLIKLKLLDLLYTNRSIKRIPNDVDIIITNTFWSPIIFSVAKKRKIVVDVQRVPKGQMKFYKNVARLRANSTPVYEAIKEELTPLYFDKIVTVHNPLPFKVADEVNISKKKNIILYTGRVHPEKGLDLLIAAFVKLNIDWELRIVGPWGISDGGGGVKYLEQLKNQNTSKRITFLGPIYNEELLNNEYSEASVFVYPSVAEKGETFGLAPLESMAWGCAPVVSSLKCFLDFIKEDINGLVFDHRSLDASDLLASKIKTLVNDSEKRILIGQNALKVREKFATKKIALDFINCFDEIVKENK